MKPVVALLLGLLSLGASAQESSPTLDKIAASGTIYLGHSEASQPFSYVLPGSDRPTGYSWEICGRVVKAVEAKLGKSLSVVPVMTSGNTRLLMVKTGMADLECGATTNTAARQKQVAFSTTFFVAEVKVLVRADSGLKSLTDLADKRVVTTNGSPAERLAKQAALQRNVPMRQVLARSPAEALDMLMRGEADAYVADDTVLAGQRSAAAEPQKFALLDESLAVEPYALILPAGDPVFKKLVDDTLAGMMKSGELAELYAKWFTRPIPPLGRSLDLPLSEINRAAFQYPSDRPGF